MQTSKNRRTTRPNPVSSNAAIPFIAQRSVAQKSRTCGAASLAMVYQSLGIDLPQHLLFRQLSSSANLQAGGIKTYRLARHALLQGLTAFTLRVSNHPTHALQILLQDGWSIIANFQLSKDSRWGHFAVILGIDFQRVLLHDPLLGPNQKLSHTQLLDRWQAPLGKTESSGFVLVAIRDGINNPTQEVMQCPQCHAQFPLAQQIGLGASLPWKTCWECLFCPGCDAPLRPHNIKTSQS